MQNDTLYNAILKKMLIISVTFEGDDPVISDYNMKPSELAAPGNTPVVAFIHLTVDGITGFELVTAITNQEGTFTLYGGNGTTITSTNEDTWYIQGGIS